MDFLALAGATIMPTALRSTRVLMSGLNSMPWVARMMVLPLLDSVNCMKRSLKVILKIHLTNPFLIVNLCNFSPPSDRFASPPHRGLSV